MSAGGFGGNGAVDVDGERRRVVVTGLGVVSPLGHDAGSTWASCREGQSGIDTISLFDASYLPAQIAGEVKDFEAEAVVGRKEVRRTSRCIQLALAAARQAASDSCLNISEIADDVGVLIASGIGGLEVLERATIALHDQGPRRVSPFTVPAMIPDMPSGMVAIDLQARGPNFAIVSACASSAHAIGEAAEWIRRGDAVAVLAGGTEASITDLGIASFCAMQALSTRNDEPQRASRPFDKQRQGFVMGEGAGILVLEDYDHARARGAHIHGEVVGYAATADASHITAPSPDGEGAKRSVLRALARAGRRPEEVGYINAHGTGTPLNDTAETRAFKGAFGEMAGRIPMSSTKSMHGHLLGAAGALETIITLLALRDQFAPPTINLDEPDPDCDLDYIPNEGRSISSDLALCTSFGFGGHNACLALTGPVVSD